MSESGVGDRRLQVAMWGLAEARGPGGLPGRGDRSRLRPARPSIERREDFCVEWQLPAEPGRECPRPTRSGRVGAPSRDLSP